MLYYAGIVDGQLDEILEVHKRDTVSTFGTHSSRRVTKKTTKQEPSKDDCSASRPNNDQSEIGIRWIWDISNQGCTAVHTVISSAVLLYGVTEDKCPK